MALQHTPPPVSQPSGQGFLPTLATGLTKPHQRRRKRRGKPAPSLSLSGEPARWNASKCSENAPFLPGRQGSLLSSVAPPRPPAPWQEVKPTK